MSGPLMKENAAKAFILYFTLDTQTYHIDPTPGSHDSLREAWSSTVW